MKQIRQYIRQVLLTEAMKTQRLHHSRQSDQVDGMPNFGPYSQPSAAGQVGPDKPNGIWYDCDGQWEEFCKFELGQDTSKKYDVAFEIFPSSTVLFITNDQQFDEFEKMYGVRGRFDLVIDWAKVAGHHDGIEICPYRNSKRMGHFWYYGWDVASGCIWSPRGIKSVKKFC